MLTSFILLLGFANALESPGCALNAKFLNQDPYPAVPGEYVKVVFQLDGINSPKCKEVSFEIIPQYPFSLNPGVSPIIKAQGGAFVTNYQSYLIAPYELRIDRDAIDGENTIEVRYNGGDVGPEFYSIQSFNITIKDSRTDFEVSIKDYDKATGMITFDILNTGKHNIEALTVDIPKQDNFNVKGSNRNIVGSLDSNEDTTFSFEADPKEGEISLMISYTDQINVRRQVEKKVFFDPTYFEGRVKDQTGNSSYVYIIVILAILVAGYFIWKRRKKKKMKNHHSLNDVI